ncbi:MAG: 3-oxoacyl-[acyl-carrier-protein] reductase [Firmicutes bacterium]|nr:3-oxoacyl-[acyl-carrier-protein] reductase [Bacillota bacterium]
MIDLNEKVAVITGGSRGIGAAICLKLANFGAHIAIIGNSENPELIKQIKSLNKKCIFYKCDVSDYEQAKNTIDSIIKDFLKIDILVNNAGITCDKLIIQMTEADFDKVIAVNLKGVFNMSSLITKWLIRNKNKGKIINISSIAGIDGNIGQTNYAAAKAGLIGFSKSLAKEVAARGITVNSIAPGFIETDMTKVLPDEFKQKSLNAIPLKRFGDVDDIANTVAFLASDMADYITAQTLRVDGGLTL